MSATEVDARATGDEGIDLTSPQAGNTHGRMTALTLHSPIRKRWLPVQLAGFFLAKWAPIAQRHTLQFDFIHHVRWTVVHRLPFNGAPQVEDKLRYPYLFFESNFDGPWHLYIDSFAYIIPTDIRFVWGRGVNFPGPPPAEPLKKWIAANSLGGGTFYSAYPLSSTRVVLGGLATRDALRRLIAESRGLAPEAFKIRYEQFLTEIQAHL